MTIAIEAKFVGEQASDKFLFCVTRLYYIKMIIDNNPC